MRIEKLVKTEKATFAAGCFWGVQHILDRISGVVSTRVGYIGGKTTDPTYRDICNGDTGHAEAVEIEYDPAKVSFKELLSYFWRLHDPTQRDRQGVDVGTQYRSGIFYHSDEQKKVAELSNAEFDASKVFSKNAVTEIVAAGLFFSGEDYHQKYFDKNDGHICHVLRPR